MNAINILSSKENKKDRKPKVEASEVTMSALKVKFTSMADRIMKPMAAATTSWELYEVDSDGMEIAE
jgi:hypothetical protein